MKEEGIKKNPERRKKSPKSTIGENDSTWEIIGIGSSGIPGHNISGNVDEYLAAAIYAESHPEAESLAQRGKREYEEWRRQLMEDPEARKMYEQQAPIMELRLALMEARFGRNLTREDIAKAMGTTRRAIAMIEIEPYDQTVETLRKYLQAVDPTLQLRVTIFHQEKDAPKK